MNALEDIKRDKEKLEVDIRSLIKKFMDENRGVRVSIDISTDRPVITGGTEIRVRADVRLL